MVKDVKALSLRLPTTLHTRVSQLAAPSHRSVHAQILYMLQTWAEPGTTSASAPAKPAYDPSTYVPTIKRSADKKTGQVYKAQVVPRPGCPSFDYDWKFLVYKRKVFTPAIASDHPELLDNHSASDLYYLGFAELAETHEEAMALAQTQDMPTEIQYEMVYD